MDITDKQFRSLNESYNCSIFMDVLWHGHYYYKGYNITLKSENSLTPVCMAKPLEAPATRREMNYWATCLLVVLYI